LKETDFLRPREILNGIETSVSSFAPAGDSERVGEGAAPQTERIERIKKGKGAILSMKNKKGKRERKKGNF
jgi:hypothetical protein